MRGGRVPERQPELVGTDERDGIRGDVPREKGRRFGAADDEERNTLGHGGCCFSQHLVEEL